MFDCVEYTIVTSRNNFAFALLSSPVEQAAYFRAVIAQVEMFFRFAGTSTSNAQHRRTGDLSKMSRTMKPIIAMKMNPNLLLRPDSTDGRVSSLSTTIRPRTRTTRHTRYVYLNVFLPPTNQSSAQPPPNHPASQPASRLVPSGSHRVHYPAGSRTGGQPLTGQSSLFLSRSCSLAGGHLTVP